VGELKRKIPVEYVLFDREHVSELLCNTPSCLLITEPRLKRFLAKKVHRNTRTLNIQCYKCIIKFVVDVLGIIDT
jgi:hypothetical protein